MGKEKLSQSSRGDRSCEEEETRATGHAHSGDEPDGSGGGEAVNSVSLTKISPAPMKPMPVTI
jgi:hypothetical protein